LAFYRDPAVLAAEEAEAASERAAKEAEAAELRRQQEEASRPLSE